MFHHMSTNITRFVKTLAKSNYVSNLKQNNLEIICNVKTTTWGSFEGTHILSKGFSDTSLL